MFYFQANYLASNDTVAVEGEVTDALPNTQFTVELDSGQTVRAHLSGKMKMHRIRVLPGDRVTVEMSPYDLSKGRITIRHES